MVGARRVDNSTSDWRTLTSDPDRSLEAHRVRVGTAGEVTYASEAFRPVLIFGPQRSFKTSGFAIPAILDWDGPTVVTSVRRDVLDDTIAWRSKIGNVYVFDPSGSLKGTKYEQYRHSWDFLDHCRTWDDCVRMGNALTEAGRLGGISEEGFWFSLAGQLLAPHLFAASQPSRTLADVIRWIKTQEESEVRDILTTLGHDEAIASAENAWQREDRARSSVYTTTSSVLRVFDYDTVAVDDPPFLDIDGFLGSASDTIYICAPPDEQEEFKPLFTGLVRTIVRKVYHRNNQSIDLEEGAVDSRTASAAPAMCPLLLLLDEAGNIAALENLDTLATTAAGTKVQLVTIFHDMSQVEGIYGVYAARSIVNNHSAFMILPGARDTTTLEYVETLLRGERVANSADLSWSGPRPIRGMKRGEGLLIYENLRPIVLELRSKFTDDGLERRVKGES